MTPKHKEYKAFLNKDKGWKKISERLNKDTQTIIIHEKFEDIDEFSFRILGTDSATFRLYHNPSKFMA